MQGDPQVIDFLNKALLNELTAINQYWLHYRMLDNWGVKKLAAFERHESIDEMKHADQLADRILFLGGLPNFQSMGRLRVGENVEEILKADLALEHVCARRVRFFLRRKYGAVPEPLSQVRAPLAELWVLDTQGRQGVPATPATEQDY